MNIKVNNFIVNKLRPPELALLIKWIFRVKRQIHTFPDGRKVSIDPISDFGLKIAKNEGYEKEMTDQISSILKPGDTFIDLGGNEGYFSIIASGIVGQTGKVITIEPQQRLWEIIINNSILNSCYNIQLLPYGISSTSGEATMTLFPNLNTGASSLSPNFNFYISLISIRKKFYKRQKIYTKTLDVLSAIFPKRIKLIKIDIEGFEYEALKGSENLLKQHVFEYLLIEIHRKSLESLGQKESDVMDFLSKFGYQKRQITNILFLFSLQ
jgi:FkbM family methyltransferase